MGRRTVRTLAFGAALAALLQTMAPAAAQGGNPAPDDHYGPYAAASWSVKKVSNKKGQCTMILNHGALGLDAAGTRIVKERFGSGGVELIEWTGECGADGLITGRGTLYIDLDSSAYYLSRRFVGTADRGVLNGAVSYNPYYDVEADEYGELDPDQPVTFVNGCNNWAGARPNSCDTRQADRLRSQYLAGNGAAPKPGLQRATPPAVAAKPTGPVAVDIPPSQTGNLNQQQNSAAAAWLKADTEAKRVQAEKVADFERKKAEFDRQQAAYAREQEQYRAALAAHQAEVDRVARVNADIDACNKGDTSRCPAPK